MPLLQLPYHNFVTTIAAYKYHRHYGGGVLPIMFKRKENWIPREYRLMYKMPTKLMHKSNISFILDQGLERNYCSGKALFRPLVDLDNLPPLDPPGPLVLRALPPPSMIFGILLCRLFLEADAAARAWSCASETLTLSWPETNSIDPGRILKMRKIISPDVSFVCFFWILRALMVPRFRCW